ncbi:hypothetical protein E2C01_017088 [Portunus trituberculatus]|uniref:Uncharacterized protein n=1 Tax=Portunus trituberculatus TaxID=210409 RepID=A0A5B7DRI0_PORTR|nr:hypothetical protein [Portunus trituberculatus]
MLLVAVPGVVVSSTSLPLLDRPTEISLCRSPNRDKRHTGAAVVQWIRACFGIRGVSKRTGSNPVYALLSPKVSLILAEAKKAACYLVVALHEAEKTH